MKNETLLQKVRESNVQGPFKIDSKASGFGLPIPLFLKKWKKPETLLFGKSLKSTQDVANYLEKSYLGKNIPYAEQEYSWKFVDERKRGGGKVLKILSIPHPASKAVRYNHPDHYIWLRIKPSF